MEDITIREFLVGIGLAILGGVGWLWKRIHYRIDAKADQKSFNGINETIKYTMNNMVHRDTFDKHVARDDAQQDRMNVNIDRLSDKIDLASQENARQHASLAQQILDAIKQVMK